MLVSYYDLIEKDDPQDAASQYTSNLLSIEEMRNIFLKRKKEWGLHAIWDIDLYKDSKTNLYFTYHNFLKCDDLLTNHVIAEQLFAQYNQVDWMFVTNCYEHLIIDKLETLLLTPLVWFPTEELGNLCVVNGKVAKERKPPKEFSFNDCRGYFFPVMREKALLWFADTLPTVHDLVNPKKYGRVPEDMVIWDRLLYTGPEFKSLRQSMEYIVEERGEAKAVEIIERFRADWPDIITLQLFDFGKLDEQELERRRRALFEEMERYLRVWKAKAEKQTKNEHVVKDTTDTCAFITNQEQTTAIIGKILSYLKGKSTPRDVMMPIRAAMDAGVIRRPTYGELQQTFPNYCPAHKSSVSDYTNISKQPYIDEAYKTMVEEFKKFV